MQPLMWREADRVDRRDRQPRGHRFVQRADFALQVVVPLHDDARAFVEPLAFRREHERPLRAVDQLHAQPLFQAGGRPGWRSIAKRR